MPSDPRSLLFGSRIASLYVQPHIGGDMALLTGVAKRVLERGGQDAAFVEQSHRRALRRSEQQVESTTWGDIETGAGVSRARRSRASPRCTCRRSNVVIGWTMGITHHLHGVENVQMIANLALLRGMIGRPHAGLLPIRGHSNVQGMGSVGVTPSLKQAILARLEERLGVRGPDARGLDTMACIEACGRGEMDAAICLGGNLFGSNPDATFAEQGARQARPDRVSVDLAEQRPCMGDRERDAGVASASARRGAAADDAGVDVQLCAVERWRAAHGTRDREARCRC